MMNSELRMKKDDVFGEVPDGISFKIQFKGKATPAFLPNTAGIPQLYSAGAAVAVGISCGWALMKFSERSGSMSRCQGVSVFSKGLRIRFLLTIRITPRPNQCARRWYFLNRFAASGKLPFSGICLSLGAIPKTRIGLSESRRVLSLIFF